MKCIVFLAAYSGIGDDLQGSRALDEPTLLCGGWPPGEAAHYTEDYTIQPVFLQDAQGPRGSEPQDRDEQGHVETVGEGVGEQFCSYSAQLFPPTSNEPALLALYSDAGQLHLEVSDTKLVILKSVATKNLT